MTCRRPLATRCRSTWWTTSVTSSPSHSSPRCWRTPPEPHDSLGLSRSILRWMAGSSTLATDYFVVGAGALGMAFVDSLIEHGDADVVLVERRHRPGGHWLDAYPFVQLHQPSRFYGVDSTALGQDRVSPDGTETGFERASGAEICGYF